VHRVGAYATVGLGIVNALTGLVPSRETVGAVVNAAALLAAMSMLISYRKHVSA
jgi:hypothetical protein